MIHPRKKAELETAYLKYMRMNYLVDPIDMQMFVVRIGDSNPNFLAYLFDDPTLCGKSWKALDKDQMNELKDYLLSLDPMR